MASPRQPRRRQGPAGWGRPPHWLFRIQVRIFLSMALLAAVLLFAASLWIERTARQTLEEELDLRLHAVGGAAASLIDPGVVPALVSLTPAQSAFRLYRDRQTVLEQLRERTGVRRIFLADTLGRSYVDTDPRASIGMALPQMRADLGRIRMIQAGRPAAGSIFTDSEGQIRKTGYVPVMRSGQVLGVVGVEADATFLGALRTVRARILGVGLVGMLAAFLMAALVSRGLTRPTLKLVQWARLLGRGDLSARAPVEGRDEIAFLGHTLEAMREGLEGRDRELRSMVAGVAHEIRNPLGGIRLYAELLDESPNLDEQSRARLGKILRELDHLGAIVDEFLLYARPAAPSPERIDLEELVGALFEGAAAVAGERGVRLQTDWTGRPGIEVRFDPVHLNQILRNLIHNAVEAVPDGGTVRVGREENPPGIWVEDSGPGIPDEEQERIFEPFYTTKPNGAGLGLAIVRRLALLNGAGVEAGPGREGGARFVLWFKEGEEA